MKPLSQGTWPGIRGDGAWGKNRVVMSSYVKIFHEVQLRSSLNQCVIYWTLRFKKKRISLKKTNLALSLNKCILNLLKLSLSLSFVFIILGIRQCDLHIPDIRHKKIELHFTHIFKMWIILLYLHSNTQGN